MTDYATNDNPRFCSFEGCGRKHYGNGLCQAHNTQRKRGVALKPIKGYATREPKPATLCAFETCDKPSRVGGLCSGHRNQKDRGQEMRPLRPRRANGTTIPCSFEGCRNDTTGGAHDLCRGHHRQRRMGRDLEPLPDWVNHKARDEHGRKQCSTCREWLDTDMFHGDSHRHDGLQTRCKTCTRSAMLINTYGITADQYDVMLSAQNGGCAICGAVESFDGSSLAVDHDHACCPSRTSCGKCVRALLCCDCNRGIGSFHDSPELLSKAIKYLRRYAK